MVTSINGYTNSRGGGVAFKGVDLSRMGTVLKHVENNPIWQKGIQRVTELSDRIGQDIIFEGTDAMSSYGDFFISASNKLPANVPWRSADGIWGLITSNGVYNMAEKNMDKLRIFFEEIISCLELYGVK